MVKLAVFDLDNTLLTEDKKLTDATLDALRQLQNHGVKIAVATGRTFALARPFVRALKIEGPNAYNNGALIETDTGTTIYKLAIPQEAQRFVVDYALKKDLVFVLYGKETIYGPSNDRLDFFKHWNQNHPEASVAVCETTDRNRLIAPEAFKVLIRLKEDDDEDSIMETLRSIDGLHVTKSQNTFIDITAEGAHKGNAIKRLMEHYDVGKEETLAFGDNDNDAEMLRAAGFSYAMKNGTLKAKEAASRETADSAEENGVAKTLLELQHHFIMKEGDCHGKNRNHHR